MTIFNLYSLIVNILNGDNIALDTLKQVETLLYMQKALLMQGISVTCIRNYKEKINLKSTIALEQIFLQI